MCSKHIYMMMFKNCSYCKNLECFKLYKYCAISVECTSLFLKRGMNQAVISVKFTMLHTATIKSSSWLLSESQSSLLSVSEVSTPLFDCFTCPVSDWHSIYFTICSLFSLLFLFLFELTFRLPSWTHT